MTAHVMTSVGWFGAVAAFLALAVAGLRSADDQMVHTAYSGMDLVTRYVIVPLAFASLLTGLVCSLGTPWGLVRHYWVLVKLLLVVVATIVLVLQLSPIGYLAGTLDSAGFAAAPVIEARTSLVVHAAGGLLVLLGATILAIYKPRGLTRYGRRRASS